MPRNIVVFSTIAKDHDIWMDSARWGRWRPLVELMRMNSFPVRRLYYFVPPSLRERAEVLRADLSSIAPHADIVPVPIPLRHDFSPAALSEFYAFYDGYFERFHFDRKKEDYYFHFGPGNIFAHSFMFTMLINIRKLPCRIVQLRFPQSGPPTPHAEIYDGSINKWVADIGTLERDKSNACEFLKSSIKTRNRAFNALIRDIEHVATHSTAPILLSGPTGSGKSQLARRIYELRRKRGQVAGNFVEINCSTLRGESAMSNLFGHVKGSFTGAVAARKGFLSMADNGILFLDEIGELTQDMQILLLKAIEEKSFIPFGADEPVRSDFQLICASNRDLADEARAGNFRLDLLSRINLWEFRLPSLRERPEDIEPNIDYELKRLTAARGVFAEFTPTARRAYVDFASSERARWPSNFRALAGSMERMLTYSFHGVLDDDIVQREIAHLTRMWAVQRGRAEDFPLLERLGAGWADNDLFEKIQLEGVLRVCLQCSTRSKAGRALFARSRLEKNTADDTARLNKYLKAHGLTWEQVQSLRDEM